MTRSNTPAEVGGDARVESLPPASSPFGGDWRFRRGAVAFQIQKVMSQDGRPDIIVENHQPGLPPGIRHNLMAVSIIDPEPEPKT